MRTETFLRLFLVKSFVVVLLHYVVADKAKVYKITRCNSKREYPVVVDSVVVEEKNGKVFVSGSLATNVDLISPISASLTVKRYVEWMNSWFPVICINRVGSCTYNDLCYYGVSQKRPCPDNFAKNNVPCRCPISEGNYTMQPDQKTYLFTVPKRVHLFPTKLKTPVAGTYWVEVDVKSHNSLLTCYQFYIDYNDETTDSELQNEIEPFVTITS